MNQYTLPDLAAMDNATFLKVVAEHPKPSDWMLASAFQYAATRLARLQGLVIPQRLPP